MAGKACASLAGSTPSSGRRTSSNVNERPARRYGASWPVVHYNSAAIQARSPRRSGGLGIFYDEANALRRRYPRARCRTGRLDADARRIRLLHGLAAWMAAWSRRLTGDRPAASGHRALLADPGTGSRRRCFCGQDQGVVREPRPGCCRDRRTAGDPFNVAILLRRRSRLQRRPAWKRADGAFHGQQAAGSRSSRRRQAAFDRLVAEALTGHLKDRFNPDAFFLVEVGALGRDSALRRAGEAAPSCGVIPCYEDEPADLARLAREALAGDKLALSAEALDTFVARLPHERGVARREIERLILLPRSRKRNATRQASATWRALFGVEPEAS